MLHYRKYVFVHDAHMSKIQLKALDLTIGLTQTCWHSQAAMQSVPRRQPPTLQHVQAGPHITFTPNQYCSLCKYIIFGFSGFLKTYMCKKMYSENIALNAVVPNTFTASHVYCYKAKRTKNWRQQGMTLQCSVHAAAHLRKTLQ